MLNLTKIVFVAIGFFVLSCGIISTIPASQGEFVNFHAFTPEISLLFGSILIAIGVGK